MPRQQLQARSDGRYSCRLGDKYFYGSSPTAAQKKRDGYVKELTLGFCPDLADTEFLDYAMLWLKAYRAKCNNRQKRQYETMIEYAAETLPKPYLRTINATDIQMLFNSLEGMSASYIKKFCTTIRSIFRAAVQDGVIVRTPADMAKPPEGTSGEHRCLEQWEQNLIVDTYNEHDFGPCAMAMMFAGLRRGEALYLNIDRDVDFEHRIITGIISTTCRSMERIACRNRDILVRGYLHEDRFAYNHRSRCHIQWIIPLLRWNIFLTEVIMRISIRTCIDISVEECRVSNTIPSGIDV